MRAAILATAAELFASRGYRGVTMDEIARRRGMSKRTLYQYFASKEEMADSIVAGLVAELGGVVDRAMTAGGGFPETFGRVLHSLEAVLAAMPMTLLEDLERHAPHIFARITEFRAQQMRRYIALLTAAQAAGEVPRGVDPALAVDILIAAVQETGRPEWMRRRGIGIGELMAAIGRIFLHGVCGGPAGEGERHGG